jgi:Flp pilus assembly pilin Flp
MKTVLRRSGWIGPWPVGRSGQDQDGASSVEYGLMVAAIAAVVIAVVIGLSTIAQAAFR